MDFLTGTTWTPLFLDGQFGVLPLLVGTIVITFWACLVAIPCGLGAAIFLSEYARPRVRGVLKPVLEVLAGIPTVVYGYFAPTFFTPFLRDIGVQVEIFNALSAGLVMGVMLIPLVASLSEDAMFAVPQDLRDGGYALGATRRTWRRGSSSQRQLGHRRQLRARHLAWDRRDDDRAHSCRPARPDLRRPSGRWRR